MKRLSKRQKNPSHEETERQVRKLLIERGSKALEQARNEVLQEKIECKEAREALTYFITEYWHDLARPTLFSLACEAVGGDQSLVTRIAVPMILISGAMDIHDDIIDQSEVKRSSPTVLGKFGKDIALLVGDALMVKGFTLLCEAIENDVPPEKAATVIITIQQTFFELGDAEASELNFRGGMDVVPEEYLRIVRKKAADVEAYARIGAILGGGSKEEIAALGEYGRLLGTMAILRDDLMDMSDSKEIIHRIKMECLPLPILYALQNPEIKATLTPILLKKEIAKRDTELILEVTRKTEEFAHFEDMMQKLAQDASYILGNLKNEEIYLSLLVRSIVP